MPESLGLYISVPFCRAKCTYCNFASDVSGPDEVERYVERLRLEIGGVNARAMGMRAELPRKVDTIYLGGGTPSLLSGEQVRRIFEAIGSEFSVAPRAEITLECAPGQLEDATLKEYLRQGMNRVSFGVQSFVDREARAVGRLHTREVCLSEIDRLRAAGVENINVDLIAGLPHQTAESWRESVEMAIATGVAHVSVYMLEVDEDSRLGREVLHAGQRYGAGKVPDEDAIADWYLEGCERLERAGVRQYEISNFAREGWRSRHNVKYWRREPYVGFGLDAHSMLRSSDAALRWANASELGEYLGGRKQGTGAMKMLASRPAVDRVGREQGFEETLFLGLRMNEGVDLARLRTEFGDGLVDAVGAALDDVVEAGLVERQGRTVRLTSRGCMASNEVFSRLLVAPV
jgi:oxygen-independent coproporphyrinogen III oxidase